MPRETAINYFSRRVLLVWDFPSFLICFVVKSSVKLALNSESVDELLNKVESGRSGWASFESCDFFFFRKVLIPAWKSSWRHRRVAERTKRRRSKKPYGYLANIVHTHKLDRRFLLSSIAESEIRRLRTINVHKSVYNDDEDDDDDDDDDDISSWEHSHMGVHTEDTWTLIWNVTRELCRKKLGIWCLCALRNTSVGNVRKDFHHNFNEYLLCLLAINPTICQAIR